MLKPKKSRFFEFIFSWYSTNLLRRKFNSLRVSGLEGFSRAATKGPLVVCVNHSSWWDGIVAFYLSNKLGLDSYVMMEEKHLRRYFLFRRLGAFSVVREQPRKAYESVKFATELLNGGGKAVWIFPQGEILPNDSRPIEFYGGIEKISQGSKNHEVVIIALRYEFIMEPKPEILARIQVRSAEEPESTLTAKGLAGEMTAMLDDLKRDVVEKNLEGYANIL